MEDQSGNRSVVRPAPDERCPECGEGVEHEWFSFREDPDHSEKVLKHFSGIVRKLIEPEPVRPERPIRDISLPEDLGHFFHPWCAPRAKLPAEIEKAFADILAKAIVALSRDGTEWVTGNVIGVDGGEDVVIV